MCFLYRTVTKLDANISTVVNAIVLLKTCQGLTGDEEQNTTSSKTARDDDLLFLYVTKANADFL